MAWNAPATATVGQLVTASFWNAQIRDNFSVLDAYLGSGIVNFAEDTSGATTVTSTSYAADSPSVAVTATTGTSALLIAQAKVEGPTGDGLYMGYAVSGASTIAAADSRSILVIGQANAIEISLVRLVTSLTAGSNVFTMQWKVGSGTAFPNYRRLAILPIR